MDKRYIYILVVVVFVLFVLGMATEKLSMSQFPVPSCSNIDFYTCGGCGTIYQDQNKLGQTCACDGGSFTHYKTASHSNASCGKKEGMCTSCSGGNANNEVICPQAAGTFDSGWLAKMPEVAFPPVFPQMNIVMHKQLRHVSVMDVQKHLDAGGLIVAANTGKIANYAIEKLIEETMANGSQGYPNFYYIEGPVVIMNKICDSYYWMIDYPIKYTPANFGDYVNTSTDPREAMSMYAHGVKLLNQDAPVFFFAPSECTQDYVKAVNTTCVKKGTPQSSTDQYYPGCYKKSCLWGPDYGSGNWLNRV